MTDEQALKMYETGGVVFHVVFCPDGTYKARETCIDAYQVAKDDDIVFLTSGVFGRPKAEKNHAKDLFETREEAEKCAEEMMDKYGCYVVVKPKEYREFMKWKKAQNVLD